MSKTVTNHIIKQAAMSDEYVRDLIMDSLDGPEILRIGPDRPSPIPLRPRGLAALGCGLASGLVGTLAA